MKNNKSSINKIFQRIDNIISKNNKLKKLKSSYLPFILIFIIGFAIMIYPVVSQFYYRIESNQEMQHFEDKTSKLNSEEIKKRIRLADAYNHYLKSTKLSDPYSDSEKKKGVAEYARMLEVHEMIGHINIPRINQDIPIYAGTSEFVLQKGVGHLEGTSLPIGGKGTHLVLTAHRGLPTAKLFRNLNRMKKGDVFFVHNIEKVLAYEVDNIQTVEPTNFEPVMIKNDKDYCTLLTCTPYMINSHRLLVRGHRIPYIAHKEKKETLSHRRNTYYMLMAFILIIFITLWYIRKKLLIKRKKTK